MFYCSSFFRRCSEPWSSARLLRSLCVSGEQRRPEKLRRSVSAPTRLDLKRSDMTPFFRVASRRSPAPGARVLSTAAAQAPPTRRRLRELPLPLKLVRDLSGEELRVDGQKRSLDGWIDGCRRMRRPRASVSCWTASRTRSVSGWACERVSVGFFSVAATALSVVVTALCATLGGCNGLSYTMNYADKKEKMEEEVNEKGEATPLPLTS
jgi:hypothetical protein